MISGALPRGLAVLETLAHHPDGLTLAQLCTKVDIPKAAVFRALSDLIDAKYVRQRKSDGVYMLSIRFPALALKYFSQTDAAKLAQPILKRVAEQAQEHVRIALVEGDKLIFMAHEEGSRSALRFNSEAGTEPHLYYTATGWAWLSGFSDEKAMELVAQQGIGDPSDHGPNAPSSIEEFLAHLKETREQG
ncbi:MAG TPA: helix-turn-helix domain-containing protein, partial [Enteractinococcus helveticum]